ncbi:salivary protein [Culex quinquefasciatus]|uniref:Salivary protein n=1 Tax=Culex quinquefasciatus TaxID=7176 RepID=B0VZ60_CULQU|nr:salivary protein [Culex quinquefasciatus]|eukprot:XP_001841691.1 salivary protein [Culex quinquefasciatus]
MFCSDSTTFLVIILFKILVTITLAQQTPDYCVKGLCPKDTYHHVGCNTTRAFNSTCVKPKMVPMSTKRKNLLMMMHNRLRNHLASGKLDRYQKASNMSLMDWDDELAYLAELNVKQCVMEHDECRSTVKFFWAGQNLANRFQYPKLETYNLILKAFVKAWFKEHVDASMEYIRSYKEPPKEIMIGHFTALVRDVSTHMGCAIAVQTKTMYSKQHSRYLTGPQIFLACNYANTNLFGQAIYREGQPCSQCSGKCHKVYTALCDYR